MQSAAFQTCIRLTARSLPAREVRNAGSRWASQSQTLTPKRRCTRSRLPLPAPTQIAHGGRFPWPLSL